MFSLLWRLVENKLILSRMLSFYLPGIECCCYFMLLVCTWLALDILACHYTSYCLAHIIVLTVPHTVSTTRGENFVFELDSSISWAGSRGVLCWIPVVVGFKHLRFQVKESMNAFQWFAEYTNTWHKTIVIMYSWEIYQLGSPFLNTLWFQNAY